MEDGRRICAVDTEMDERGSQSPQDWRHILTESLWNKLSEILHFDFPYKTVAQTFNPQLGYTDVWTDIDFYEEKRFHPTQKPLKLIRRLIEASSNEGDIILDPFSGAGSTQISCIQLKRHYIAIELDETYYNTALKRIEESTMASFADNALSV